MGWVGNFQHELRRRRMYRAATVYLVVAWGGTEIVTFFLERLPFPDWTVPVIAIGFIVGFPVAMLLAWQFDITTDGVRSTGPSTAKGNLTILLSLLLLIGGTTGLYYLIYPDGVLLDQTDIGGFDPPSQSVAVLPFIDLSQDQDQEYLANGLAETLLHQLAKFDDLHVIARGSSFAFSGEILDLPAIGRRLNVGTILHGSVQKQGGTLRITAQLEDTVENTNIWSRSFDRPDTDIFEIQDDIAMTVANALRQTLSADERQESANDFTESVAAFDLYLLGRYFWHQRTEEALLEAIDIFGRAIELDPGFALAYSALADAYGVLPNYSDLRVEDIADQSETAAMQALGIDPDLPEAHASIGLLRVQQGRTDDADRELEYAIEHRPGYAMAHMWYARSLIVQRRYKDALFAAEKARRLDPLSAVISRQLAVASFWTGDDQQAAEEYDRAIQIAPESPYGWGGLGILARLHGDYDDAVRHMANAVENDPDSLLRIRDLAWAYLGLGEDALADDWLAKAESTDADDPYVMYGRKLYYLETGLADEFVEYEEIATEHNPDNLFVLADLALAYAHAGDFSRAVEIYESVRARELPGDSPLFQEWNFVYGFSHALTLIKAYQMIGLDDQAADLTVEYERFVLDAIERGLSMPHLSYSIAGLHLLRGNEEVAMEQLHTAYDLGWRSFRIAWNDPVFDALGGHPEFAALMARIESDVQVMRDRLRADPPERIPSSAP